MKSLRIRDVRHLCRHLGTNERELQLLCQEIESHYYRHQETKSGKVRQFATPTGRLRAIVENLKRLLGRLELPDCVHGGRRGRSYETNAEPHLNQKELLKSDITNFFPSIRSGRVYDLFVKHLECSPDVARYLTRLVTVDGAVPQGSPTSTVVAALVTGRLARRMERMADQHGAKATQYVDDLAVSGQRAGRLKGLLRTIVEQEGFSTHPRKTKVTRAEKEQVVTGVRVDHGRDVPSQKICEVRRQIAEIGHLLEEGAAVDRSMIRRVEGRLHYISRLNPGAAKCYRRRLHRLLRRAQTPS
jgi:hypothetical protein